jgi:hypothetical protein
MSPVHKSLEKPRAILVVFGLGGADETVVGEVEGFAEIEKCLGVSIDEGPNGEIGSSCGPDVLGRVLVGPGQEPDITPLEAVETSESASTFSKACPT